MQDALLDSPNNVLVNCRNGKDRSCFAVYAFLRLFHRLEHTKALKLVQQRVGPRGYPLFDIGRQSSELVQWVEHNVEADLNAESGLCNWQFGTSGRYPNALHMCTCICTTMQ